MGSPFYPPTIKLSFIFKATSFRFFNGGKQKTFPIRIAPTGKALMPRCFLYCFLFILPRRRYFLFAAFFADRINGSTIRIRNTTANTLKAIYRQSTEVASTLTIALAPWKRL